MKIKPTTPLFQDQSNRDVCYNQCIFIDSDDVRQLFHETIADLAFNIGEIFDFYPSNLWDDEFIDDILRTLGSAIFERYQNGEILYVVRKNNMAIDEFVLSFIRDKLPYGSTILEFGSGRGTEELSKTFTMLSVEENLDWVGRYDSKYLHADIIDDWYDVDKVNSFLEDKTYDAILIDGPDAGERVKIVDLISSGKLKLNTDVHILIDDVERKDGFNLSNNLQKLLERGEITYKYPNPSDNTKLSLISYIKPKENKND